VHVKEIEAKMIEISKKRKMISRILMVLSCSILLYNFIWGFSRPEKNYFFDNAICQGQSDEKVEEFTLNKATDVKFIFKTEFSQGNIKIELKDSQGKIYFTNNENAVDKEFTLKLQPNTYYYYLKFDKLYGTFLCKGQE
jgi:hypothetical protein